MRGGKSSQYRIRLNQCRSGNNYFLALSEPAVDFVGGEFVMFMPRTYRRNLEVGGQA